MVQFRRNQSGDTFIKIEDDKLITKVIVREYDHFKQFVIDTNEVNTQQLHLIEIHYPVLTREKLYLQHLEILSKKINSEINSTLEKIHS